MLTSNIRPCIIRPIGNLLKLPLSIHAFSRQHRMRRRARALFRSGSIQLHRAKFRWHAWRQQHELRVDIDNASSGLFAQLNWCLYVLAHCDRIGIHPHVRLIGPLYANESGRDWLRDLFVDCDLPARAAIGPRSDRRGWVIKHINATHLGYCAAGMTLPEANRVFSKYLRPGPHVQGYVDAFVLRHFCRGMTIGVHYRGTDKITEAPAVSWDSVAAAIEEKLLTDDRFGTVFVATDDLDFLNWIKERLSGRCALVSHDDQERSVSGKPIHLSDSGDRAIKGFEALVNCLLLSRCDLLIRTASFLSGWSSVFNPGMPVVMLNQPYKDTLWFPDREVLKVAMMAQQRN